MTVYKNIYLRSLFHKILTFCLFVCNRGDTIQYHGGLRSRELGQAPMLLVFLTPRQALSSHPRQQMVWLYWLQDRDSMPNWYTINHPTTLHTHNETGDPLLLADGNLRCRMYPAGKVVISRHLAIPGFHQSNHTVSKLIADAGSLCSEV